MGPRTLADMRFLTPKIFFILLTVGLSACLGWEEIYPEPGAPPPNQPPRIETVDPAERLVRLQLGTPRVFQIRSVFDQENDPIFYHWRLNGTLQSNGNLYTFTGYEIALHQLEVRVWDCPLSLAADADTYAQCRLEPPEGHPTTSYGWTIEVEP
jgi:hypothetical protein